MKRITGPVLARRIRRFIRGLESNLEHPQDKEITDRLWDIVFTLERGVPLEVKQAAADEWSTVRSTIRTNMVLARWLPNNPSRVIWLRFPGPKHRTYQIVEPHRKKIHE